MTRGHAWAGTARDLHSGTLRCARCCSPHACMLRVLDGHTYGDKHTAAIAVCAASARGCTGSTTCGSPHSPQAEVRVVAPHALRAALLWAQTHLNSNLIPNISWVMLSSTCTQSEETCRWLASGARACPERGPRACCCLDIVCAAKHTKHKQTDFVQDWL